jgi:type III pantothenate kinase
MRTLTLAIGNTTLRAAVFAGPRLLARFDTPALAKAAAGTWLRRVARRAGRVDRAAMCSVVPSLTKPLAREIERSLRVAPHILTADSVRDLVIGYRQPSRMGADRVAAAFAARALFPGKDVVVVDCGTATTVTAVRRDGAVPGGAIMPGLDLWAAMLARRTAQLPDASGRRSRQAIGRSPEDAIAAGVFIGHAGAIRELARRVGAEAFRGRPLVIGTGGNARRFANEGLFDLIEPDLALKGLRIHAEKDTLIC